MKKCLKTLKQKKIGTELLLFIIHCIKYSSLLFREKVLFCSYLKNTYPDVFTEKSYPICMDK